MTMTMTMMTMIVKPHLFGAVFPKGLYPLAPRVGESTHWVSDTLNLASVL